MGTNPNVPGSRGYSRRVTVRDSPRHRLLAPTIDFVFSLQAWARTWILIVCCVAYCLACSELPEILSLSDDASSDLVLVVETRGAINPEAERGDPEYRLAESGAANLLPAPGNDATRRQALPGAGLLTLLAIRRI